MSDKRSPLRLFIVLSLIFATGLVVAGGYRNQAAQAADPPLAVSVYVDNLKTPWDMTFTPDGTMLVNQRGGGIKARLSGGEVVSVAADFSDLAVINNAGLMGMVVDPDFANNRRFYTCQAHQDPAEVQVISWTISENYRQATRVDDPLVGAIPMRGSTGQHSGCRLRFGPDGYLYISTGDAAGRTLPQDLTSLAGKVLRVDSQTGLGAADNPFIDSDNANSKLVYTYGHRNPQGLARRPGSSQMWAVEHGPAIDDEINLLVKGGNYGWEPISSDPAKGFYYENVPMTDTSKFPQAVEAKWSSGIGTYATAGGIFLEGSHWGNKEGWLAVATLKNQTLYLFDFSPSGEYRSVSIPLELKQTYGRLRSVIIGPDQALYITTSVAVLRVIPASAEPPPPDPDPDPPPVGRRPDPPPPDPDPPQVQPEADPDPPPPDPDPESPPPDPDPDSDPPPTDPDPNPPTVATTTDSDSGEAVDSLVEANTPADPQPDPPEGRPEADPDPPAAAGPVITSPEPEAVVIGLDLNPAPETEDEGGLTEAADSPVATAPPDPAPTIDRAGGFWSTTKLGAALVLILGAVLAAIKFRRSPK